MEDEDLTDVLRTVEIAAGNILVPVSQLPAVTVGGTVNHPLVTDLRICLHPDHKQVGTLISQFLPEIRHILGISDLLGEGSVDQDFVLILESLKGQIKHSIILVVSDVLLKEVRTAVALLTGDFEDLVGKHYQRVLVKIHNMIKALGNCP